MAKYRFERAIQGHSGLINALQFSPDGQYLASGGEDGLLLVTDITTGTVVRKFEDCSPVTALVWHPRFPKTIISGHSSGDVHTICFDQALVSSQFQSRQFLVTD
jgi:WD40 repeat protein